MSSFIDRCYNEQSANSFLNSCKVLMNKIDADRKFYDEGFKDQQFLIFSGMLSYYGYFYLDEIVKAFKETEFFYVSIDYEDFKRENPEFAVEFAENPIALTRRAVALELLPPRLVSDNTIWLFVQNDCSDIEWLEIVAHEINHIVNSINKSLAVRWFDVIGRTGCSLYSNRIDARGGLVFEESVNVLQTAEIMNHILGFLNFDIHDEEIRGAFDKYRNCLGEKRKGIGYTRSVPYIRELYQQPSFNDILVLSRLNGNLDELKEHFEGKTYVGAYNDLLEAMDKFYFCTTLEDEKIGKEKVKELTKRYNNLYEGDDFNV